MGSSNWMLPAAVGAVAAPFLFPAIGAGMGLGTAGLSASQVGAAMGPLGGAWAGAPAAAGLGVAGAPAMGSILASAPLAGPLAAIPGKSAFEQMMQAQMGNMMKNNPMGLAQMLSPQQQQQAPPPMAMAPPPMPQEPGPGFAQLVAGGARPGYMPQPTAQMIGRGYG